MKTPTEKTLGLTFPCTIDVKIFVKNDMATLELLKEFTVSHLGEQELQAWRYRESSGGKYLAITASVVTVSREHIDSFYQALHDHEHVIMSL